MKKIIDEYIGMAPWEGEVTMEQIKKDVDKMLAIGVTHVIFYSDYDFEPSIPRAKAICRREETEDEYGSRLILEERIRQQTINEELFLLKKLKKKYERTTD